MPKMIEADDDEAVIGVRLVKAQTFELDPDKQYLILFDRRSISKEDTILLGGELQKHGIEGVTVGLIGDPGTVRIIEQEAKAKK
jgi:hypothetical protein